MDLYRSLPLRSVALLSFPMPSLLCPKDKLTQILAKVDNLLSRAVIDGRGLCTNGIWGSGEVCEVVCVEMVCVSVLCV
jgi:hypothetical protein